VRDVREPEPDGTLPLRVHPEWESRFPWLVQGTTGRGSAAEPFDLGLFGGQPVREAMDRWEALRRGLGAHAVAHARQVHGNEVWVHESLPAPGLLLLSGVDGHLSAHPGLLLAVSVADCVPVSLVEPTTRRVALLHAGWRGVAAGIVERGVQALLRDGGSAPDLWLHCGPAICGRCYEVGPEVHRGVRPHRSAPAEPCPIDLRAAIGERAAAVGIHADHCTRSVHCTRCGDGGASPFFSHRGGDAGRQMAVLGIR
jgi:polyphenol oxidase